MDRYDLALIGFGGVNRALAELMTQRGDHLADELGFILRVVAITDLRAGSLVDTDGIDLVPLLSTEPDAFSFAGLAGGSTDPRNEWVIRHVPADIVVEATYTNPTDGEPALSHVRWAIESGKHVCTTNKGPVALAGRALKALAAEHGVSFEFEGSVLSGTPVLRTAQRLLGGLEITGVQGIMNGTSNYILGRLEEGRRPAGGHRGSSGTGIRRSRPHRRHRGPRRPAQGHDPGQRGPRRRPAPRGRLLRGHLRRSHPRRCRTPRRRGCAGSWSAPPPASEDGTVDARVAPLALPAHHPLAGISGPVNAVAFHTDLLGTVTVSGPGAGRIETAYALLSDIIAIHERHHANGSAAPGQRVLKEALRD